MSEKVCVVGSGNWGTAIARLIGLNVSDHLAANTNTPVFSEQVNVWVFEEVLNESLGQQYAGKKLTEVINTEHQNPKYLPGVSLPPNLLAVPDLGDAIKDATLLVFVVPHQFLKATLKQMKGKVSAGARAISLMKGVDFENNKVALLSAIIERELNIPCCALMGANVAPQVANDEPAEATVGYREERDGRLWQSLFDRATFRVNYVNDVAGGELCGALKNIVGVAAGISDGLGFKDNTKAAIVRIGLMEMKRFAQLFFPPVHHATYLESCGVADLITTCYAGRHRRVAEAFVKIQGGKSFEQLAKEMLNGQKLQGTITAYEVYKVLEHHNLTAQFPLFAAVCAIAFESAAPSVVVQCFVPVKTHPEAEPM